MLTVRIALLLGLAACHRPAAQAPVEHVAEPAPPPDAAPVADRDGDGITDDVDACPDQPMVMSGGCDASRQRGCPDDCRPPTIIDP